MGHVTATYTLQAYRARNDDGSETGATWKASENTAWTLSRGETFRLRVAIGETAGGKENNVSSTLQYSINGGGYTNVTTSTPVQFTASANVSDGATTTNQIGGGGTFRSGQVRSTATGASASFSGTDHTEHEWVLRVDSGQLSGGETIRFRTLNAGATMTYSQTPTMTVATPRLDTLSTPPTVAQLATAPTPDVTTTANLPTPGLSQDAADAEGGDSIGGTVTDENGVPLEGAELTVVDSVADTIETEVTTESDGSWQANVPPGTYHIAPKHDSGTTQYAGHSYPQIVVAAGAPSGATLENADLHVSFDDTTYENDFHQFNDSGLETRSIVDADGREGNQLQVQFIEGSHRGTTMTHVHENAAGTQPTHAYQRFMYRFDPEFQTASEGKLPGFAGRDNPNTTEGAGGNPATGTGWSARMGFNEPGTDLIGPGEPVPLEFYLYHLDQSGSYGDHLPFDYQGSQFAAEQGVWYEIEQELDLGEVNTPDGELRAWIDGVKVFERTGLRFRTEGGNDISRSWFDIYHGGSTTIPATVSMWIDDLYIHRNGIP